MEDLADPEVAGAAWRRRPNGRGRISVNGHSRNGNGAVRARPGSTRVLVLNASYEPINVCTVRRAAVLVLKSRAEVLEKGDGVPH